ncbi:hypothetical protein NHX12_004192 [Muraenolepis orangiensis]|uniref:Transcriptional repressor p66 coiled-coil MBD2-interaction domain-containing protein n=1 Tax=Muraenolepis orangiensis TaxID=630683 RepID=A0A9Q0DYJ9_9TELE|nr:hypothetical protein NHX12_004192 [Muraenolepis orangiensis]
MSEEAVRLTRSQKRALEKDGPAASSELSDAESDSKKPKMDDPDSESDGSKLKTDDPEPETQSAQSNHDVRPAAHDDQSPLRVETEAPESHQEPALNRLPLPSLPTTTPQPAKDEPGQTQDQQTVEPISDNRTDHTDGRVKAEPAVVADARSRLRPAEPKTSGGILATGEVKATIKVEVQTTGPVDMSTSKGGVNEKHLPAKVEDDDDDDVIILSDNDSPSPPMNGLNHFKELDTDLLMKSSPEERGRIIKQLKEELRLEEAKLVLLKKLRQSQIQKDTLQKPSGLSGSAAPPPLIRGTITGNKISQQQIGIGRSLGPVIPPPLVRGGQQLLSKHGSQIIMPPLVRGAQQIQSGSSNMSVVNINDTPASRQAAAKLALRKQLEKTLLEIPPPKPPAPEFNFLPSAANNEFIYLVGLEEVVQNLLDTIHRGKTGVATSKLNPREPFTCTQCSTDFTCRWRQDKAKSGTILCEDCMSSNQKKALKAEHTNRLKAAFVKALQQEQEIEQRILQHIKQSPQGQLSRGTVSSMGVRGVPHSFSSSSQLQSAVAAAALVNRPGKHAHVSRPTAQSLKMSSRGISGRSSVSGGSASASAWKKQSDSHTGVTMAYVNPSLSGHKTSSTVDPRQREYLLDMIPSRSISQTANTWK